MNSGSTSYSGINSSENGNLTAISRDANRGTYSSPYFSVKWVSYFLFKTYFANDP